MGLLQPLPDGTNIPLITIVCGWVFMFLALLSITVVVGVCYFKRNLDKGNFFVLVAFGAAVLLTIQTTWAVVKEGQGTHIDGKSLSNLGILAKSLLANELLWGLVNTLVRLSALIGIKTLLAMISGWPRKAATVLQIISVVYFIVLVLEPILICRPITSSWNPHVSGKCGDQIASFIALEIVGAIIDLAILILPLPIIWGSKLPVMERLRISVLMSLGIILVAVTSLRLHALKKVNDTDFTYSRGYLALLSSLGALMGVTICCAMSLRFFFKELRARLPRRVKPESNADVESKAPDLQRRWSWPRARPPRDITAPQTHLVQNPKAEWHRGCPAPTKCPFGDVHHDDSVDDHEFPWDLYNYYRSQEEEEEEDLDPLTRGLRYMEG